MKFVRALLLLTATSPVLYVSSYLLTVEAHVADAAITSCQHVPHYLFGGKLAEQLFAPLHLLDTQVRTTYWHKR